MLDFCGGTVTECFHTFMQLTVAAKVLLFIVGFIAIFIILRLVFWVCTWFE
ncbi:MAG: hypothetical protein H6908_04100 [Hyphomicrobiales bacterium]|nr:hypothetical protein [Hyphomicrobiales bacterium]